MAGDKSTIRVEVNEDVRLNVVRAQHNTYADAKHVQGQYGHGPTVIVSSSTMWRDPAEAREHALKLLAVADWLEAEMSQSQDETEEWDGIAEADMRVNPDDYMPGPAQEF